MEILVNRKELLQKIDHALLRMVKRGHLGHWAFQNLLRKRDAIRAGHSFILSISRNDDPFADGPMQDACKAIGKGIRDTLPLTNGKRLGEIR